MPPPINKFDREINALKGMGSINWFNPIRQARLKQIVLQKAGSLPQTQATPLSRWAKKRGLLYYLASIAAGLSLLGGTAFAASSSLPGDALYSVKKIQEKLRLSLAVSEQTKAEILAQQAQERLRELQGLKSRASTASHSAAAQQQQLVTDSETETKKQVDRALKTLTQAQSAQEEKGNNRSAAALGEDLEKLKTVAREANIFSGTEAGVNSDSDSEDSFQHTSPTNKEQDAQIKTAAPALTKPKAAIDLGINQHHAEESRDYTEHNPIKSPDTAPTKTGETGGGTQTSRPYESQENFDSHSSGYYRDNGTSTPVITDLKTPDTNELSTSTILNQKDFKTGTSTASSDSSEQVQTGRNNEAD